MPTGKRNLVIDCLPVDHVCYCSINDTSVPFLTAAIESEDPFLRHQGKR